MWWKTTLQEKFWFVNGNCIYYQEQWWLWFLKLCWNTQCKYGNHSCFPIGVKWIRIVKVKRTVWNGIFMHGLCEKFGIGDNTATWLRAFKSNGFILLNCAWQWILFCLIEGLFTNLVRVFHSISVQQLNVNWIFEKWWWNNVIYIDLQKNAWQDDFYMV